MPSSSSRHNGADSNGAGPSNTAACATPTYDPTQDLAEKRALRKDYRSLIAKADEARANMAEHSAVDLKKYVEDAEGLRGKIKAPNEGILDSRFLYTVSEMGAQMAKNMKLNANAFDVDEYIGRVARFIGGSATAGTQRSTRRRSRAQESDEDDDDDADDMEDYASWNWHRLGSIASRYSRRAPTMDHLLGPLAVEARTRSGAATEAGQATKRRRILERAEEEEAPQQLREGDIVANEAETSKLVKDISKKLRDVGGSDGCNLFEFVIDPESFSNTVENLFYVSFLIREGKASIDDNPEGVPILLDCHPPDQEDYGKGLRKRQVVLELDYATYRGLIEAYGITKSIIPSRKARKATVPADGKWYG